MRTIKVKVAVAVGLDGSWNAAGCGSLNDEMLMDLAVDPLGDGEARYWLTAELRVPEASEVAASVEAS